VDAVCSLRLSEDDLKRKKEAFNENALSLASLKISERQVQQDRNTLLTAERSLRYWKLADKEIDDIKAEAKTIIDQKKVRTVDDDMKWARVEIRVPKFKLKNGAGKEFDPTTELTVVEKNTHLNDMLD